MDSAHAFAVLEHSDNNFAILGQAGTGKTFLLKKLYEHLKLQNKNVSLTCSTGIACQQYQLAVTLHRYVL